MRIAYHSDSFARANRYGLSRYSHEQRDALVAEGVDVIPFSSVSDFGDALSPHLRDARFVRLGIPRKYLAVGATLLRAPRAEWLLPDFDILHSIDVDYAIPTRRPWVVTLHDLGPITHPHFFAAAHGWLLKAYVRAIVRRADKIICVSQSTADELETVAKVPLRDRIEVIPEGVSSAFLSEDRTLAPLDDLPALPSERPFFLTSGSVNPRKNLPRLLRAFMSIADEIPHDLVMTGTAGWDADEVEQLLASDRAVGRIHRLGYVSDELLQSLLRKASGFLYPSLYEGFGLPILEAMASRCPVLTSGISSMPEVAGDCAILVDPYDEDSIADGLQMLAKGAGTDTLVERGYRRAQSFSWERSASRTRSLYAALATSPETGSRG